MSRRVFELIETYPLHAGALAFFVFMIVTALLLGRARYHRQR